MVKVYVSTQPEVAGNKISVLVAPAGPVGGDHYQRIACVSAFDIYVRLSRKKRPALDAAAATKIRFEHPALVAAPNLVGADHTTPRRTLPPSLHHWRRRRPSQASRPFRLDRSWARLRT
ncbi:hypothetical protein L1887_60922 [Cichorium endivia]|nr:hypothetical protein L1887_60922 [Cichorium endivia]